MHNLWVGLDPYLYTSAHPSNGIQMWRIQTRMCRFHTRCGYNFNFLNLSHNFHVRYILGTNYDIDPLDPVHNHFNDTIVNFFSHSIDTFKNNSNLNPKALNIMHHNSRSIMKLRKLDEYELFF